jgi:hypothetical protein
MAGSMPLGRRLIKLTVDAPPAEAGGPRRGYRRIGWTESYAARAGQSTATTASGISALLSCR